VLRQRAFLNFHGPLFGVDQHIGQCDAAVVAPQYRPDVVQAACHRKYIGERIRGSARSRRGEPVNPLAVIIGQRGVYRGVIGAVQGIRDLKGTGLHQLQRKDGFWRGGRHRRGSILHGGFHRGRGDRRVLHGGGGRRIGLLRFRRHATGQQDQKLGRQDEEPRVPARGTVPKHRLASLPWSGFHYTRIRARCHPLHCDQENFRPKAGKPDHGEPGRFPIRTLYRGLLSLLAGRAPLWYTVLV